MTNEEHRRPENLQLMRDNESVSYGWEATRRFRPERAVAY
jgi:hypothetical protein